MLDYILTLQALEDEAKEIDAFLNITSSEQAEELKARESDLMVYMSRLGKMEADAKYWKDEALSKSTEKVYSNFPDMTPSMKNTFIKSMCKKENHLVNWITRMGRIATHQHEGVRSLLAFARVEYANTPGH